MAVNVEKVLRNEIRLATRVAFQRAARKTRDDLRSSKRVPVDTGDLKSGIELRDLVLTGNELKANLVSTTTNQGFDYPAFLNQTSRVAPTKRKFLKFQVGGSTVFSKGFDNVHKGWWDEALGLDRGDDNLWCKAFVAEFEKAL